MCVFMEWKSQFFQWQPDSWSVKFVDGRPESFCKVWNLVVEGMLQKLVRDTGALWSQPILVSDERWNVVGAIPPQSYWWVTTWRIGDKCEVDVSNDACFSNRLQLHSSVRYVQHLAGEVGRKKNFWNDLLQQECRFASIVGYLVPYQSLTAYQFRREKRARAFPHLLTGMSYIRLLQFKYVVTCAWGSYVCL